MSAAPASVDERMMKRALRLARKGRPSPNPHVGAVVVAAGVAAEAATNSPAAELCVIAVKAARIKIIEMERDVRLTCGYRRINPDVSWFMNIES